MTGVSNTITKLVNFLTSPFESGDKDDIFEELGEEFEKPDFQSIDNVALDPTYRAPRASRKVVPLPTRGYAGDPKCTEIIAFEPRSYNESKQIAEALKEKKTVILNLQLLDREQSLRVVDFLCGCTFALEGDQKKIGDCVFIFTPDSVSLSQETVTSKLSRDALWNAPQTIQQ